MLDAQSQQIESIQRQLEALTRRMTFVEQPQDHPYTQVYIAKTGSAISAIAGSTPGSGTVTLYEFDSAGDLTPILDVSNNAVTATAHNIAAGEVAATTFIQLKQEMATGRLIVDFEDCS